MTTTTTRPDHAAEITRADNAIRSLTRALEGMRSVAADVAPMWGEDSGDVDSLARHVNGAINDLEDLIRRETRRRDAAELAQHAAAE